VATGHHEFSLGAAAQLFCDSHSSPATARSYRTALAGFAADLAWLSDQGAHVERHNLSQEPGPFAESDVVRSLLSEPGGRGA